MNKTKLKYVKYTKKELDRYVRDKNSCISLTTSDMHVGFPPWGFANFQETLTNIISRDKIGKYDVKLNGIVLDVRNIKVFGTSYPVQDDDPINHINIKANFYIFQPRIGAIVKGVVKHISHGHIAVIIYRVFNVSIRFNRDNVRDALRINQQISFRIKKFDLSGAMPYIEGEFIEVIGPKVKAETNVTSNKHMKFDDNDADVGADSGISTEETNSTKSKKKAVVKKEKKSSDSSSSSSSAEESSSESESGSEKHSRTDLVNQLFKNIKVKEEKVSDSDSESDSDDDVPDKKPTKSSSKESSEESSSDSESEDDTKQSVLLANIKKEKKSSSEKSSSSSDSDSDSDSSDSSSSDEASPIKNKFKPIPVKTEPMSDAEHATTSFKKPATNVRRSLNLTTPQNRKRTSSVSEQLDSLLNSVMKNDNDKRKSLNKPSIDDSMDIDDLSTTTFQSPALSSTLKPNSKLKHLKSPSKIKIEPDSEDEVAKKKRKQNGKSLSSLQNDLFNNYLK